MDMNKLLLHAVTQLKLKSTMHWDRKRQAQKSIYYLIKNQVKKLIYAVRNQGSGPFIEGFLCTGHHI